MQMPVSALWSDSNMRIKSALIALLLTSFIQTAASATVPSAEDVVRATTSQTLARLVAQRDELKKHPERIYDLIHELVIPHFDFPSMSKWVLGPSWRDASDAQRDAFVGQFRTLLVRTYAKALLEYSEQEIKFLPTDAQPGSNLAVVKTEVNQSGGGAPVPIHYRMHISGGEWKVVDVAVDGVSLVSTYRGSFASEIRKSGIDGLISKLSERNARLESSLSEAPQSP